MDNGNSKVERGSGNVFTDLGHPDPETHLLKAELVTRIDDIIRGRGLKQVEAAKLLGLSRPDVSRLLRGNFRDYSVERPLRLLTALGATFSSTSGSHNHRGRARSPSARPRFHENQNLEARNPPVGLCPRPGGSFHYSNPLMMRLSRSASHSWCSTAASC